MENRKYELTEETIQINGRTLYRIRAMKSFCTIIMHIVNKGDLGGYVERESNLSQKGECWIFPDCAAMDNASVCDHAIINDNSVVRGNTVVLDDAAIYHSKVFGNIFVKDSAYIDNSFVTGSGKIGHQTRIIDDEYHLVKKFGEKEK